MGFLGLETPLLVLYCNHERSYEDPTKIFCFLDPSLPPVGLTLLTTSIFPRTVCLVTPSFELLNSNLPALGFLLVDHFILFNSRFRTSTCMVPLYSIPKYKVQPPLTQRLRNNYYHLVVLIILTNIMHASNRIR